MAIPFNIPVDEEDSTNHDSQHTVPNTPLRPFPIPQSNNINYAHSPQLPQIDNDMLVQAFYEALCRCSQGKLRINK